MSWLSIVLFIIKYIPDLISLIKKILELIHGLPHAERIQARAEIGSAIKSGDHDNVRQVVKSWHRRCEGMVGCPTDVIKE